jgi:haloalkane dehalogenase
MENSHNIAVEDTLIHYQVSGSGAPLLMVHGWPFHGETWSAVAKLLNKKFQSYIIDLPGLGLSRHTETTDFSFTAHARRLKKFAQQVIGGNYFCIAHDTGATIARYLALEDSAMQKLVILNTEIPGHRPPWIEAFQTSMKLPGSRFVFKTLIQQQAYLESSAGFGGCFFDKTHLDADFKSTYVAPLVNDNNRMDGVVRYLLGIDFKLVDRLRELHGKITIPVEFIWGADDPTFPEADAREMLSQFPNPVNFHSIPHARLMVHMERPELVAEKAANFLAP